jgi:hypothetical protein
VTFPTRSTVKQFRIDWAGGPRWKMPRPVAAEGQTGSPIKLSKQGNRDVLQGTLVHELPGELQDVVIVVNKGLKDYTSALHARNQHPLLADVKAFSLPASWRPGDPLDLGTAIDMNPPASSKIVGEEFLKAWTERLGPVDNEQSVTGGHGQNERMMGLAFFPQLEPPNTAAQIRQDYSHYLQRKAAHGYDLGVWFSQPCIIVVGRLVGDGTDPCPPWVSTGGAFREAKNTGTTYVRWVYPLPPRPMELNQNRQDRSEEPLPAEKDAGGGT